MKYNIDAKRRILSSRSSNPFYEGLRLVAVEYIKRDKTYGLSHRHTFYFSHKGRAYWRMMARKKGIL